MRPVGRLVALFLMIFVFAGVSVKAEDVTVTIGVGDTILAVSGQTSPDALVTISKDGGVIGTVSADSTGSFGQTFPAQEPGIHQLSLFAHTNGGQNTDTASLNVNITEHATTTVDVFLPPTLNIANTDLDFGQQLELSGESAPSATITIYIDNSSYTTTTADSDGLWNASTSTESLASGEHSLFVRAVDSFGEQSYPSASRTFSLATEPEGPPPGDVAPDVPIITFPQTGTLWTEPTITVTGTADDEVQIELWDGADLIGSVWSDGNGDWSMLVQLQQKEYELRARACLDQRCSDFSPTVRFSYGPTTPLAPNEQPLDIDIPQSSFTVYVHQTVTLRATVVDGQPPYEVTIRWDDGTTETRTFKQSDLQFSHAYDKPGKYNVRVDIQDSQGRKNRIFFSVDVKPAEGLGLTFVVPLIALSLTVTISLTWLGIIGIRRLLLRV